MSLTDLFMLDLKQFDSKLHVELTGKDNANILDMARYLSDNGKEMWIRHVLVPGVTDDENDLRKMSDFIASLKTVSRVEILPYHTLGVSKWQKLGIPYPLEGVPTPTDEQVKRAEEILNVDGVSQVIAYEKRRTCISRRFALFDWFNIRLAHVAVPPACFLPSCASPSDRPACAAFPQ